MDNRDKYGNYKNNEGVTIKINTDKDGRDHISFYDNDVDSSHKAQHINIDYDNNSWNSSYHNEDKSEKSNGSGGCYLTTACMKHQKEEFDDKCEELQILRWFRDMFVHDEDIEHYYQTAPIIVESINEREDCDLIYKDIYDNVIKPCVEAIKKEDYYYAYQSYKDITLYLEEEYLRPKLEKKFIMTLKNQL